MSCTCRGKTAFQWRECDCNSIFLGASGFQSYRGKSQSQIQSEVVNEKLATYGRGMAMGWISKTGPVADPKKLAVSRKRKGAA